MRGFVKKFRRPALPVGYTPSYRSKKKGETKGDGLA